MDFVGRIVGLGFWSWTFSFFFLVLFSFFSFFSSLFLSATWLRSYTPPPKSTMCRSAWSPSPVGSWRLVLSRRAMGHTNCQKSRSRDWGFLAYLLRSIWIFGLWVGTHPSELSFPFLPLPGDGRGLGGVYFFSTEVAYVSNDLDFFIGLPSPDVNVRAYLSLWRSYLELQ